MKCDGEVSRRGKEEKQMQNGTVKLKKRAFFLQSSPEAVYVIARIIMHVGYQDLLSLRRIPCRSPKQR